MAAMLACVCVCCVLLTGAYAANDAREAQKVTPVEKVIELLKRLQEQTGEEGKKEAAQYDKFACFCKEQADEKLYAIEKSKKKIKGLIAKINMLESEITALTSKVKGQNKRIAEIEAEIKSLSEIRAKEKAAYDVQAADLDWAIDAIKRAIKALNDSKDKIGEQDAEAKLNLVQIKMLAGRVLQVLQRSPTLQPSNAQLKAVTALVQQAPASYTYQSNDIIATLEGLLVDFKQNKKELDQNEFDLIAAYEKNVLNLNLEMKFLKKEKEELLKIMSSKEEELSAAKEEQGSEEKDMKADQSFLAELTDTCEAKAEEFDQRSSTRAAELTAIAKAIRILEEGVKPNYGANKKLVELQRPSAKAAVAAAGAVSLLQHSSLSEAAPARRVLQLLESAARRLDSEMLSSVALKVRLQADHFVKVRGLIKDLLAKLEADAEAEAETKSFCDKAMTAAIESRDEANAKLEEYGAETSRTEALKARLQDEIAELSDQIKELNKALNEAMELRMAERAENEKTIADAESGQAAVEMAIKVLSDFYENAFLQNGYIPPNADRSGKSVKDLAPETFSGTYHGNQEEGTGIIAILEVILSDFERTIDKVTSEEEQAQAEFEKFEEETKADIEAKTKSKEEKEKKVVECNDKLAKLKDDTIDAKKQLDSALSELDKLKPMCVEGEESYEERRAKREKELAALKEALDILENWKS